MTGGFYYQEVDILPLLPMFTEKDIILEVFPYRVQTETETDRDCKSSYGLYVTIDNHNNGISI